MIIDKALYIEYKTLYGILYIIYNRVYDIIVHIYISNRKFYQIILYSSISYYIKNEIY